MGKEEARLRASLCALKRALDLSRTVEEMLEDFSRTAAFCALQFMAESTRARIDVTDPVVGQILVDSEAALTENIHSSKRGNFVSKKEARALVDFIWSGRTKLGGGPPIKYDPKILGPFRDTLEKIAGRRVTFSRPRRRKAPQGEAATGPPEGKMLEVLIAALEWARAVYQPGWQHPPLKPEGLITALKKLGNN